MKLKAEHFKLIDDYLSGKPLREIAAERGTTAASVSMAMNSKSVRAELEKRFAHLGERVLKFKLDAFDAAENSLLKLANLSQNAKTEELQRLASLDCIKISGLMPRKRVLVETNNLHGIDSDTREWLSQVEREANVVKADVIEQGEKVNG